MYDEAENDDCNDLDQYTGGKRSENKGSGLAILRWLFKLLFNHVVRHVTVLIHAALDRRVQPLNLIRVFSILGGGDEGKDHAGE